MQDSQAHSYQRIAEVISFIKAHTKRSPSLEEIADSAKLSPAQFQQLFMEWAGVSPQQFMQYLSLQYAQELLADQQSLLSETGDANGISNRKKTHKFFVEIEQMSPASFKIGGEGLSIAYSFGKSLFGDIILASTAVGLCHLAFIEDQEKGIETMRSEFPKATYQQESMESHQAALSFFRTEWNESNRIKLHLKGSEFQFKVWNALLSIPLGKLVSYGTIATEIKKPAASRAIGTAIGSNPIAFLIPCHRVIQASGNLGGFMWGETRKSAMIGWEAAILDSYRN